MNKINKKWFYKYSLLFEAIGIILLCFIGRFICGYYFKSNGQVENKMEIEENNKIDFSKTVYFDFNKLVETQQKDESNIISDMKNEINIEPIIKTTEEFIEYNLSEIEVLYDSEVKTCMSVWKITNKKSPQYKYIYNSGEIIFSDDGFLRTTNGFIGAALGSYFGDIGNKFIFKLDTGIKIQIVKIEEKDDSHTIEGFIQKYDKSILEFVVDFSKMNDKLISNQYPFNGNFNNSEDFNGKIIEIWKVEE